ncbi:MAG: VOC family protein [Actinomycetota bacterium]|nr:VOC family protein [Actinomycetota bacterium]
MSVSDYDRALAWYRDILGFELAYELKQYGWCELKTPFGFNIGLGQAETVAQGNVTPSAFTTSTPRSPTCASTA